MNPKAADGQVHQEIPEISEKTIPGREGMWKALAVGMCWEVKDLEKRVGVGNVEDKTQHRFKTDARGSGEALET